MKKQKTKKVLRKSSKRLTARDDIPIRAPHTYRTASCPLPAVSDMTIVRSQNHIALSAQATSSTALSTNFTLGATSIGSGQWDQYKILAARVTIVPDQNAVGLFTNSTTSYVPLYCVLDFDDSSNLSSIAGAQAYSNCVVLGAGESCERLFKPRMAIGAYSGTFASFANVGDLWIDAASTGVQHYGIKFYIPGAQAAQTLLPSWQISVELFVALRKSI